MVTAVPAWIMQHFYVQLERWTKFPNIARDHSNGIDVAADDMPNERVVCTLHVWSLRILFSKGCVSIRYVGDQSLNWTLHSGRHSGRSWQQCGVSISWFWERHQLGTCESHLQQCLSCSSEFRSGRNRLHDFAVASDTAAIGSKKIGSPTFHVAELKKMFVPKERHQVGLLGISMPHSNPLRKYIWSNSWWS